MHVREKIGSPLLNAGERLGVRGNSPQTKVRSRFLRTTAGLTRKAADPLKARVCATVLAATLCLGIYSTQIAFAASQFLPPAKSRIDFARHIAPILQRCHGCHGAEQQMSGLRLDRRE